MNFRPGTCRSCGARYRMPLDFPATRAQCKQCQGVVDVPELSSPEPTVEPAPIEPAPPQLEVVAPTNGSQEAPPEKEIPAAPPQPAVEKAPEPPQPVEKPVVLQPAAPQASKPRSPAPEDKTPAHVPIDEPEVASAPEVIEEAPEPVEERAFEPEPAKAEEPETAKPAKRSLFGRKPKTEEPAKTERASRRSASKTTSRGLAAKRSLADKASSRQPAPEATQAESEAPKTETRPSEPVKSEETPTSRGTSPTLQKILARKRAELEAEAEPAAKSEAPSGNGSPAKKGGTLEKILARKRAEQEAEEADSDDPTDNAEETSKAPSPTLQKILARKRAEQEGLPTASAEDHPSPKTSSSSSTKGGTLQQILARKRAEAAGQGDEAALTPAKADKTTHKKPSLRGKVQASHAAPKAKESNAPAKARAAHGKPSTGRRRQHTEDEQEHEQHHRHMHGLHSGHHNTGTGVSNQVLIWSSVVAVVVLALSLLLIFTDEDTKPAENTASQAAQPTPERTPETTGGANPSEAGMSMEQANVSGASGATGEPVEAGVDNTTPVVDEPKADKGGKLPAFGRAKRDALAKVDFADVPDSIKNAIETLGQEGGPGFMRGPIREETLPTHPRAAYAQALNMMVELAQTKFTGTTDPEQASVIETAALQIFELQQALVALTSRSFDSRKINLTSGGEEAAVQRAMVLTQNGAIEEVQDWIDYWKSNQLETEDGWNAMAEKNEKDSGRKVPRAGKAGKSKVVEEEAPPGGDPGF